MKQKIKLPTEYDFSDPRLASCFSIHFLKKLEKLDDERTNFLYYLQQTLQSLEDNQFSQKELRDIKNKFRVKSNIDKSIILMDTGSKGKELFFKIYGEKERCLLCPSRRVQNCHIIKQTFFKSKRLRKHYRNFKNHLSNIMFMCPNHHDLLDKTNNLSNGNITKIISNRLKLNKRFLRDIDRELKNIQKLNLLLRDLNNKFYKVINKEIKLSLNKL